MASIQSFSRPNPNVPPSEWDRVDRIANALGTMLGFVQKCAAFRQPRGPGIEAITDEEWFVQQKSEAEPVVLQLHADTKDVHHDLAGQPNALEMERRLWEMCGRLNTDWPLIARPGDFTEGETATYREIMGELNSLRLYFASIPIGNGNDLRKLINILDAVISQIKETLEQASAMPAMLDNGSGGDGWDGWYRLGLHAAEGRLAPSSIRTFLHIARWDDDINKLAARLGLLNGGKVGEHDHTHGIIERRQDGDRLLYYRITGPTQGSGIEVDFSRQACGPYDDVAPILRAIRYALGDWRVIAISMASKAEIEQPAKADTQSTRGDAAILTPKMMAVLKVLREANGEAVTSDDVAMRCADIHNTDISEEYVRRLCGPNGKLRCHGVISNPRGYACDVTS